MQKLTERQAKIYHEIITGDSFKVIARRINLSVSGIKFHTRNIYKILGVTSRSQLVHYHYTGGENENHTNR